MNRCTGELINNKMAHFSNGIINLRAKGETSYRGVVKTFMPTIGGCRN